jgi:hypothetical protein
VKKLDSVEIRRAELVVIINQKWADKNKPKEVVVEPKKWTKEKLETADIKVEKTTEKVKEQLKTKTKVQTELF